MWVRILLGSLVQDFTATSTYASGRLVLIHQKKVTRNEFNEVAVSLGQTFDLADCVRSLLACADAGFVQSQKSTIVQTAVPVLTGALGTMVHAPWYVMWFLQATSSDNLILVTDIPPDRHLVCNG